MTPFRGFPIATVLLLCPFVTAGRAAGDDWPQFLGPERNGVSHETGLIDTFGDDGPVEVWRIASGVGMSGFAVRGGNVYTLTQNEDVQLAVALDAATGERRWATPIAPAYSNAMGDGPRATPALSDSAVFTFSGDGVLTALSVEDGSIVWSHHTVEELDGETAPYGMASSPLLVGDAVVVTVGAPAATLAAYHQQSGELMWTAGSDSAAGYSSPALLQLNGRAQIVAFVGAGALGIDPDNGEVHWRYGFETDYDCNIATPIAVGSNLFISAGESHGCALLSIAEAGDGGDGGTVRELWTDFGPRAVMRNEWQTSIHLDGNLYGFDNVGSAGAITHLECLNAATGDSQWEQLRFGKGNMIAADGKLWISNMDGELVIVRATPERFEELDRAQVISSTRQAPALSNGRLYVRGDEEAVCIDVGDR